MCLISIAPAGTNKYSSEFKRAVLHGMTSQTDGTGFAFWRKGSTSVQFKKGFFLNEKMSTIYKDVASDTKAISFKDFWTLLTNLGLSDDDILIIHHRTGTSGLVSNENCHPFILNPINVMIDEITKTSGHTEYGVLFHNGVFSTYKKYDADYSDTANVTHDIFTGSKINIKMIVDTPEIFEIDYSTKIGYNKLAVLYPGGYSLIGNFITTESGYIHSNAGYQDYRYDRNGKRYKDVGGVLINEDEDTSMPKNVDLDTLEESIWQQYVEDRNKEIEKHHPNLFCEYYSSRPRVKHTHLTNNTSTNLHDEFKEDSGQFTPSDSTKKFSKTTKELPDSSESTNKPIVFKGRSSDKPNIKKLLGEINSNSNIPIKLLADSKGDINLHLKSISDDTKHIQTKVTPDLMEVVKSLRSNWDGNQTIFKDLLRYNNKYGKYFIFISSDQISNKLQGGTKCTTDDFDYNKSTCTVCINNNSKSTFSIVTPKVLLELSTVLPKPEYLDTLKTYAALCNLNYLISNSLKKKYRKKAYTALLKKRDKFHINKPMSIDVKREGVYMYLEMFDRDGIMSKVELVSE